MKRLDNLMTSLQNSNLKLSDSQKKDLDSKLDVCETCGDPIQKRVNISGSDVIVKVICSCRIKELELEKIQEENKKRQERLERVIKNSLMSPSFKTKTFENWDHKQGNKKIFKITKKYADEFKTMKAENIGLMIYGRAGNGKTYASVSIANQLLEQGVPVICVSINALLERIKDSYKKWGDEGEDQIIRSLQNADLVIIDDLGTEQKTDWSESRIYNIIDARYRAEKPLIITTNYSLDDIRERYGDRTYDRITELCTSVLNEGNSLRGNKQKEKRQIMADLLKE